MTFADRIGSCIDDGSDNAGGVGGADDNDDEVYRIKDESVDGEPVTITVVTVLIKMPRYGCVDEEPD